MGWFSGWFAETQEVKGPVEVFKINGTNIHIHTNQEEHLSTSKDILRTIEILVLIILLIIGAILIRKFYEKWSFRQQQKARKQLQNQLTQGI